VYDVTNRESFDAISWWFAERSKYAPELAIKMIVGNKSDKVSFSLSPSSFAPFPSSACKHRADFDNEN
jgi:Ras family